MGTHTLTYVMEECCNVIERILISLLEIFNQNCYLPDMDNTKVDCDKVELRRQIVVSNLSLMMRRLNLSFFPLLLLFSFPSHVCCGSFT